MNDERDDLTGVMTRHAAWPRLEQMIEETNQRESSLSLVLMDLDNFKVFNDEHGHQFGDILIKRFAKVLQSNTRITDQLCRYGGEEFMLAMSDTYPEEALLMMEDVRHQVSETTYSLEMDGKTIEHNFTFSAGIASYPNHGKNAHDLVRAANGALYRAKLNGRNRLALAVKDRMVLKSNYYPKSQLEQLAQLAHKTEKTEAFLLREALDELFVKYVEHKD